MNIIMAEKSNLENLSERESIDVSVFIGNLAERFKYMTETVREMNMRTENFITKFYTPTKGAISDEYSQ